MKKLTRGFEIFASLLAVGLFVVIAPVYGLVEWAHVDVSKRGRRQNHRSNIVPVGRIYHSEPVVDDREVLAPTAAAAA